MTHDPNPLHVLTSEGCILDTSIVYADGNGGFYYLEWTPELTEQPIQAAKGLELAAACQIAGGGWRPGTAKEVANFLLDHSVCKPYSRVPGALEDAYITSTDDVHPSFSDSAFYVYLNDGLVDYCVRSYSGRVRACRRIPVKPLPENKP